MRKFKAPIYLLSALSLLAASLSLVASPGEQRAKARYYYLEGARSAAEGRDAEAYEFFKKAYFTDPSYAEAGNAYGTERLMLKTDSLKTLKELRRSLEMMRPYVDAYPAEINEAYFYAYAAARLDTIPEAIRVYERLDSLLPKKTLTLLHLAEAYMAAHNSDKAVEALERYEAIEGKSPQVSLKKMSFLLAAADTLGAIKEASDLIESNPAEPSYRLLKGNLYEVIGNNDSTLFYYTQAENLKPDNGAAKISLANFYKQRGDSVAYDNKMYEALLSEDFDIEAKTSILEEYLQTLLDEKNNTSRGDHLFEVLMEQYPHEPQLLDLAARYNGAKGDYKGAEEQIGYAIDLNPTELNYWGQLMRYQLADERPADAIVTYRRAAEHIEVPNGLVLMYATAASQMKDYDEAEKAYAELIHEADPALPLTDSISDKALRSRLSYDGLTRLSSLYNMLGDMYYAAGNLEKTYRAYDNSLFFFPSNALTLNNYAYFLSENGGDLDKALTMSEKALEADPENPTYLDTFAWILFKKKEYKEALEVQSQAVEIMENTEQPAAEFYHHLGDILFMNHEPEEALKKWQRALELEPDNALIKKKVEHKTFFFE